jgi:hypothetical protein
MRRQRPAAIADRLFLVLVTLAVAGVVVPHLGFYSDDWVLIADFHLNPDQSLGGLLASSGPRHYASRPVQGLYSALLYRAFGLNPTAYHLANATVFTAIVLLFHEVLRVVGLPRLAAVASALVYACLPSFSTARFWFAVFAAPLSVLLCLASLRVDLAARAVVGWRFATRRASSLALAATGLLAYEITLPLALMNPVVARLADRWQGRPSWSWSRWAAWALPSLALVVGLGAYKAATSNRLGPLEAEPGRIAAILRTLFSFDVRDGDYGLNLPLAVSVNFGDHVLALPRHAWRLLGDTPGPLVPAIALILAIAVLGYLRAVGTEDAWQPRVWGGLAIAGLGVFTLGYAIFLTNTAIQITPTGVANRTAMAAGLGVAMTVAGGVGSVLAAMPGRRWRATLLAGVVAVHAASGFAVLAALARDWGRAYQQELDVLSRIRQAMPDIPSRTTLFLGGVCPYVGPAVVFESSWDLAFALRLGYGDSTISADVVSDTFVPRPDRITTALYGEEYDWPYGPATILLDLRSNRVWPLTDQAAARTALAEARLPMTDCPPSREGVGVRRMGGR